MKIVIASSQLCVTLIALIPARLMNIRGRIISCDFNFVKLINLKNILTTKKWNYGIAFCGRLIVEPKT